MITLYTAQSVDGRLAGPDGNLDFLRRAQDPDPDSREDYGYAAFLSTVEVVVMGRRTWDFVRSTGVWHYPGKEAWVLTRRTDLRPLADERFAVFDPQHWRDHGRGRHVWVAGGGEANALFLRHGLLDRLVLSTVPVVLGRGPACFPEGLERSDWRLASNRTYPSGLVQSVYVRA